MIYQGSRITVSLLDDGIANMQFNAEGESVNKFDAETNKQFGEVVTALEQADNVKGLIVTSSKGVFIAGADITEFVGHFNEKKKKLKTGSLRSTVYSTALKTYHSLKLLLSMAQH